MQKEKSYQINGLQIDVLSEKEHRGVQAELTAVYVSINGNEPVFVGGYLYPRITKKWAKKQLVNFSKVKIEFCADHCQYFPGRPTIDGFFSPFFGIGQDEATAYQDAKQQCYMALEESEIPPLPKRAGSKKRGMSYYFGRKTAAEWRKSEDSELYIYCVLYVPKIATVK